MHKILGSGDEVPDTSVRVWQAVHNLDLYSALVAANRVKDIGAQARCPNAHGYRLICVEDRLAADEVEIALVNEIDSSVAFYSKSAIATEAFSPLLTAHVRLSWCSSDMKSFATARDAARGVFFNYLLEYYDVVISEQLEFAAMRFHWQKRISECIALGLNVSYSTSSGGHYPISTQSALDGLVDSYWLGANDQQVAMVRISKIFA